jgi:hypothetical protein
MSLYELNLDNRIEMIELSELLLSTITVEAKISNVNFKEYVLINYILSVIKKQNTEEDNIFFTINNIDFIGGVTWLSSCCSSIYGHFV